MGDIFEKIDKNNLPEHIAIIMDGNGRWAKLHEEDRLFGHKNGVDAVKTAVTTAMKIGIKHLTLYTFSTENWDRPKSEIDGLFSLLVSAIRREADELNEKGIRLHAIGNIDDLPESAQVELKEATDLTLGNTKMQLNLALSYSSRSEFVSAFKKFYADIQENKKSLSDIDESMIDSYMQTVGIPDPELMIRTSGELRISNFMLWQLAYSELYFTDKLWPDFGEEDLVDAIYDYQNRERRFGKISEQLS